MVSIEVVCDNGFGVFPGGCWFGDGSGRLKSYLKLGYEKTRLKENMLLVQIDPQTLSAAREQMKYDLKMAKAYYP